MEGELEREWEMGAGVGAVMFIQRAGHNNVRLAAAAPENGL